MHVGCITNTIRAGWKNPGKTYSLSKQGWGKMKSWKVQRWRDSYFAHRSFRDRTFKKSLSQCFCSPASVMKVMRRRAANSISAQFATTFAKWALHVSIKSCRNVLREKNCLCLCLKTSPHTSGYGSKYFVKYWNIKPGTSSKHKRHHWPPPDMSLGRWWILSESQPLLHWNWTKLICVPFWGNKDFCRGRVKSKIYFHTSRLRKEWKSRSETWDRWEESATTDEPSLVEDPASAANKNGCIRMS